MPRAIWSGAISFGLVNIPVKLYSAVKDKEIHFHMLHKADGTRVKQQLFCPTDDKTIQRSEVEKGYEVSPGHYVIVTADELEALEPKETRMIEMQDFVDMSEIDPIYFEHPYYLVPNEEAKKAYSLLVKAMKDSKRIGIGKFVMRNKEYLAAIRPYEDMIILETMHFAEEIVQSSEVGGIEEQHKPAERELKMAGQLIDTLAADFEPDKYKDEYRDAVHDLIEAKAKGEEYVMPPPPVPEAQVVDLMAALEKSLAKAREQKGKGAEPEKREKVAAGARRKKS